MIIAAEKRYFVFPICHGAPMGKVFIETADGTRAGEWDMALCAEAPDFYAFIDVSAFVGEELTVTAVPAKEFWVRQADTIDLPGLYEEPLRPRVHFTVKNGWNNDPNGLVYKDGVWHMFCQYNPCSTKWGNMCWLHATSPDLCHWTEHGIALLPDETGTMFSGSGFKDTANAAGFGENELLFYYTAAGGANEWSKLNRHTQHLAHSSDGMTLQKTGLLIPWIEGNNRDPKVIFCDELGCYVLALYLTGGRYRIFTSKDLVHWDSLQELPLPGDRECPDFFPLTTADGERRWILIGANDRYLVGQFIDGKFVPEQDSRPLGAGRVYYAAQTYDNAPDNRRVRIGWHRLSIPGGRFSQQMGVACDLTLTKHGEAFALCQNPSAEVEALRGESVSYNGEDVTCLPGEAQDMVITLENKADALSFTLRGVDIAWLPEKQTWQAGELELPVIPGEEKPRLRIIADVASLELFAGDGSSCCVHEVKDYAADVDLHWNKKAPGLHCTAWALQNIHTKENNA